MRASEQSRGNLDIGLVALPVLCCLLAAVVLITLDRGDDSSGDMERGQLVAQIESTLARMAEQRDALQAEVEALLAQCADIAKGDEVEGGTK